MRTLRCFTAILCVSLMLAPAAIAQEARWDWQKPQYSWATDPYRAKEIAPIRLGNSNRLEELLRAGNLYLSVHDCIALALENNLDVEVSRYGPQLADADLLRAEAGGLLRGVPQTVQAGADSVQAQVVGDTTGGGGGGGGGGGSSGATATEAGGAVITQTGVATPVLDPRLFFNYSFSHRSNPQSNTITTGVTSLVFRSHRGGMFFQKNFLTGTGVEVSWDGNFFESNNRRADLNPGYSGSFNFQITQRLLQGFGKAVNGRNIKVARNNQRISDLVFEQQVTATVASVVKLYWDLVAYTEDVNVKKQALALAEKLYSDNKKQVEIGTLAPIEIVSAEAQVARRRQELLSSETRLLQQETVLKNELSRTGVASPTLSEARIVTTDRIEIPDQESNETLDALVRTAFAARPEIEQSRINIENSRIGMRGAKSQLKPSLDMMAFANNNGLAGENNFLGGGALGADPFFIGNYGTVMSQLLRRNFPDYGFGVQLNIPIRNRSAQADYVRDSLQLRQQELREQRLFNQIRVSVQNQQIVMRQIRALYDAAVQERILQEQTLEAEQKKYALGASTVFFVIQYQRDLAQAQSNEVQALAAYAKARVDLDQVVGNTLETYNISLDEALDGIVSRPASTLPPETP